MPLTEPSGKLSSAEPRDPASRITLSRPPTARRSRTARHSFKRHTPPPPFRGLTAAAPCVGIDLFSRAVSSRVSSALLSLTSVFGMGTGGPSAFVTPTVPPSGAQLPPRRRTARFPSRPRRLLRPDDGVSTDLFSRAVSSQVSSALLSLTSVFGMGTGGPSAFVALT